MLKVEHQPRVHRHRQHVASMGLDLFQLVCLLVIPSLSACGRLVFRREMRDDVVPGKVRTT